MDIAVALENKIVIDDGSNGDLVIVFGGRKVHFYGFEYGAVAYAFVEHNELSVEGKRVLDVGASIGDTAIYFSLR